MSNKRGLALALSRQRRRLNELIDAHGKYDPEHPMQAYSLRRIEYLEQQLKQTEETAP